MNALLLLPGFAVLLVQYNGIVGMLECLGIVAAVQVRLPGPHDPRRSTNPSSSSLHRSS